MDFEEFIFIILGFADLVATVAYMLKQNPGVSFVMCYQDEICYTVSMNFLNFGN